MCPQVDFAHLWVRLAAADKAGSLKGHGERSRSQLLLKLAGSEIMPILAVNVLAVNSLAVNGALHALYSVKKCLVHPIERQKKCLRHSI